MKNSIVFIYERANIIANIIIAVFMLLSINWTMTGHMNWSASLLSFFTILTFIIELRIMDEYKDYEKDKIANTTRPLPRGLITLQECLKLIYLFLGALWLFALLAFLLFGTQPALWLIVVNIWLYLMYKEFFVGTNLSNYPLIYAVTHQIIIIPLVFFIVSLINPELVYSLKTVGFSLLLLGSFFTYEVGRKLNPAADKVLKTYLSIYGPYITALILAVLLIIPLYGAYLLNAFFWELYPVLIIYAHLPLIIIKPNYYKKIEGLIGLFLIYNMLFLAIKFLIG
ncbi:MAG: UbiA family prenyltransferase [Bacteriovorax sp.]|nr:UbiA family prenyltransferase [Bacteriovorax sp.]